jgi:seryl-tRNA synthetase
LNDTSFSATTVNTTNNKGEKVMTNKEKIQALMDEVETYKQAIEEATAALASAEEELDDFLAETYQEEQENQ